LTRSNRRDITDAAKDADHDVIIGILTSGGDAPGMNAIVAGACDELERLGGRALGIRGGFAGLAGRHAEPITALQAHDHVTEPGTWLGTSRWPQLREPEGRAACLEAIDALGITGLLVIGGDGSTKGARALAAALPVAVVPATIDRDLEGSALTIGMDSAIAYAVDAIERLRVTGRSLRGRAFLVQTLGAPNGFLADAVAAAAGIDDVLVPERPFDLDELARRLQERAADGSAIAVMSEAVGDAVRVAETLATRSGLRVHPTILGHAQRAATPSPLDRALGQAAGRAAAGALAAGESTFVGLTGDGAVDPVPLARSTSASLVNQGDTPVTPGYDRPLYILAFDHRTSFQTKLFGIEGEPTPDERERLREAKGIILDGLLAAAEYAPPGTVGALVDEENGAEAAREAKRRGLPFAMCAEKSSVPEFDFEFGEDFARHIEEFEPDFVKILARYNPEGDSEVNRRQAERLARLSDYLAPRETKYLFELIVPAEPHQLAALESDSERYAIEMRPQLVATAIAELQAAGVEPDIWKVEGLETAEDCKLVADAARAGGRDDVALVVLGAGADEATVAHWLRQAATVDGFVGFAIGRTIFWDALKGWIAGETDRETAVRTIADNYGSSIELFESAATTAA
jgi:6-phosphofructokinase/myo-inositol catabolism protein IolC